MHDRKCLVDAACARSYVVLSCLLHRLSAPSGLEDLAHCFLGGWCWETINVGVVETHIGVLPHLNTLTLDVHVFISHAAGWPALPARSAAATAHMGCKQRLELGPIVHY